MLEIQNFAGDPLARESVTGETGMHLTYGQLIVVQDKREKEQIPDENPKEMNVFDKVVAMIFSSLRPHTSSQAEHYRELAQKHWELKQMWLRDFGSLP